MSLFDVNDFGARLRSLLPQPWFSTNAFANNQNINTNGIAFALTQGFGVGQVRPTTINTVFFGVSRRFDIF